MLPSPHRLTNGADFASVVRRGRRAKTTTVIVHRVDDLGRESAVAKPEPARVGFVVSKAVGNSVVRHRVTRRLRAQLASHVSALPAGSGTVVRALPAASGATSRELGADVARALNRFAGAGR